MRNLVIGTIALGLASSAVVQARQEQRRPRPRRGPLRHPRLPRWPDGRISFSGSPTNVGNWEGPANASIFFNMVNGKLVKPQPSLPTNKTVDEIPFKPGMRALYDSRADQAEDPHTRCKPSGGWRFWHAPYGIEIVEFAETQEVFFLHVGAPHSWRVAYIDGRPHPKGVKEPLVRAHDRQVGRRHAQCSIRWASTIASG